MIGFPSWLDISASRPDEGSTKKGSADLGLIMFQMRFVLKRVYIWPFSNEAGGSERGDRMIRVLRNRAGLEAMEVGQETVMLQWL